MDSVEETVHVPDDFNNVDFASHSVFGPDYLDVRSVSPQSGAEIGSDEDLIDSPSPQTLPSCDYAQGTMSVADEKLILDALPTDPKFPSFFRNLASHYTDAARDLCLVPGTGVQLDDYTFVKIKYIVAENSESAGDRTSLFGYVFRTAGTPPCQPGARELEDEEDLADLMLAQTNEVVWIVQLLQNSQRSVDMQSLIRIEPEEIWKTVEIRITNRMFPDYNIYIETEAYRTDTDPTTLPLVCRWKATRTFPSAHRRKQSKVFATFRYCRKEIRSILEHECEDQYAVSDQSRMEAYLGRRVYGGSHVGVHADEIKRRKREEELKKEAEGLIRGVELDPVASAIMVDPSENDDGTEHFHILDDEGLIELDTEREDLHWSRSTTVAQGPWYGNERRYTLADIFSGSGGVSRAGSEVGFYIALANDIDEDMCNTYSLNNPATKIAHRNVFNFIYKDKSDKTVDIVHISNPCQPFSKNHTTPGKFDEMNKRCIEAIEKIILQCKPRIVTLENTDGLYVRRNCRQYFNRMIRQFVCSGYSVQARIIPLANYGAAQPRHRLIMIASCPGQKLPSFPPATHSRTGSGGLPRWVTVNEAIDKIPARWLDHRPEEMARITESNGHKSSKVINGNAPCPTLQTSNSLVHPNGHRKLSIRELASLQGFPLWHEFPEDQKRGKKEKQIGNAVPPVAFVKIFAHIKAFLLECDGMPKREPDTNSTGDIVEIEDDQDVIEIIEID